MHGAWKKPAEDRPGISSSCPPVWQDNDQTQTGLGPVERHVAQFSAELASRIE
jgi:hypothetical protein